MSLSFRMTFFIGRECCAHTNGQQFSLNVFRPPTWDHFAYNSCSFFVFPLHADLETKSTRPGEMVVELGPRRRGQTIVLRGSSFGEFGKLFTGSYNDARLTINTQGLAQQMNVGKSDMRDRQRESDAMANAQRKTLMAMGQELQLGECNKGEYISILQKHNCGTHGFV